MSLYGVQRASSKTDRQVIDKECFEDVLGNTRGQLINLQSKTCHSQDTASWNTFLWVELRDPKQDMDLNGLSSSMESSNSDPNPQTK